MTSCKSMPLPLPDWGRRPEKAILASLRRGVA